MAKTRVGIIGTGWGQLQIEAFRRVRGAEVVALCDVDSARVEEVAAKYKIEKTFADYRDLLASDKIDLVSIASPPELHEPIARAAIDAGKHVLCEKPLALTVKEAEAMLAAVQKAKVVHMVCHNYRRVPAIAQAKNMIAEGAIGQVYHYYARYAQDWLVDPEVPLRWKLQKPISGSGAHGDINVHLIDLARYLVGEFKKVCGLMDTFIKERPLQQVAAARQNLPPKSAGKKGKAGKPSTTQADQDPAAKAVPKLGKVTVDDAALFIGRFECGALANLEATRYAPGRKNHMTIEINGSKGSFCFDLEDMNRLKFCDRASLPDRQGFRDILVLQPGGVHPYISQWWRGGHLLGYEHTFVHTVADFVNACVDGRPVHPTFEDGLKNQRVLQAVEESVKAGGWVEV